MKKCPHCGNTDSYHYNEWGTVMQYTGIFAQGRCSEENVDFKYIGPPAKMAKCGKCGRMVKLSDIDQTGYV